MPTTDPQYHTRIEQVKEQHYVLRPMLRRALESSVYLPEARERTGFGNSLQKWEQSFSDRFFDMTTMIRLGSTIEDLLKHYYMAKEGHNTRADLRNDPDYEKNTGVFQNLRSSSKKSVVALFRKRLGIDLLSQARFSQVQEAMLHRHLYAHNVGVVDDKYVEDISVVTGDDLKPALSLLNYPADDVYWFKPLEKLTELLEATDQFFKDLP